MTGFPPTRDNQRLGACFIAPSRMASSSINDGANGKYGLNGQT
jgi:hypothetical protein